MKREASEFKIACSLLVAALMPPISLQYKSVRVNFPYPEGAAGTF